MCAAPLAENSLCERNSECAWPLICPAVGKRCSRWLQLEDGATATHNSLCKSSLLVNGKCASVSLTSHSSLACQRGELCTYSTIVSGATVSTT